MDPCETVFGKAVIIFLPNIFFCRILSGSSIPRTVSGSSRGQDLGSRAPPFLACRLPCGRSSGSGSGSLNHRVCLPKAVVTSRTHPSVGPSAPALVVLWSQCVCAVCPCWWEADLKQAQRKPLSSSFGSPSSRADSRALPATFSCHVPKGCTQTLPWPRALPSLAPTGSDPRPLPFPSTHKPRIDQSFQKCRQQAVLAS